MRTALVTGASGGLGRAICRALADVRHDLALHYASDAASASAAAAEATERGRRSVILAADLGAHNIETVAADLVSKAVEGLGRLDVVVLNASSQELTPWEDLDAATWDRLFAGTLRQTAVMLRAAAARLSVGLQPVIVVVGSIEGIRPAPDHGAYAVFKAATHHLVKVAAQELGPKGIRVVGVAPGLIDRPGLAEQWPDGYQRWSATVPLGRPVTASEVASAVAFLASKSASGITGITLEVDAGWSAAAGW